MKKLKWLFDRLFSASDGVLILSLPLIIAFATLVENTLFVCIGYVAAFKLIMFVFDYFFDKSETSWALSAEEVVETAMNEKQPSITKK
jgi:hypothetical protein